ncbi:MAG: SAM-dependent methyltransferase [Bacteroidales bacterium]|nr:SAM-dependent methyltransferase [Bacteroidales bacterium]
MKGNLYLIPTGLGEQADLNSLPASLPQVIEKIRHFIVEDIRSARRFLKKALPSIVIDELTFLVLNEHTRLQAQPELLKPLHAGLDTALLSEAGMPCIADPGAALVTLAHEAGIRVIPLAGPSSILLALAASGFNGQRFAFAGYLPVDSRERIWKIKSIENDAFQKDQTQIFIEAPYRNNQLLKALLENCLSTTRLCVALNLTLPGEQIISRTIEQWNRNPWPDLHKKPAVFLLYK